jgi:leucyl/phenylalanyl-tRNA--protein transferase
MRRPPTHSQIVEFFLNAYRQGAFPMADPPTAAARRRDPRPEGSIRWYTPDPRAIIPLGEGGLHVPRSLERTMRKRPFLLTSDRCFERVIRACAEPAERRGGAAGCWLNETLIRCYTLLHERGHAHSIEAWVEKGTGDRAEGRGEQSPALGPVPSALSPLLVGGIYGVSIGRCFMAESMFCTPELGGTDASKVCLVTLWEHLRACGYELLDVQIANDHTERFGVVEIDREEYLGLLTEATKHADAWRPLTQFTHEE